MQCRECNSLMFLDDKDYNFKGNYDNYWLCSTCNSSCIEQVRFNQSFREIWHVEFDDFVKDYEIQKNIVRN